MRLPIHILCATGLVVACAQTKTATETRTAAPVETAAAPNLKVVKFELMRVP